jgi:hypothetical protein
VIPIVTNRDLRRTWKTLAGKAGVPKDIRDRIQNHALSVQRATTAGAICPKTQRDGTMGPVRQGAITIIRNRSCLVPAPGGRITIRRPSNFAPLAVTRFSGCEY